MLLGSTAEPGRGRPKPHWLLIALAAVAAGAAALPIAYLILRAAETGPKAWALLWRPRTLIVFLNTTGLAAAVTVGAAAIGVPLAWLTTRTNLPGRRIWTILTMLPLVIPSYVGGFTLVAAFGPRGILQQWLQGLIGVQRLPEIYGFFGAWLALTLFSYPYVLLSVRGALLRLDPALEESARTMGRSQWATFKQVTLPLLRPAIAAGALLVALYALSDFGAVTMLQFDAFTRAIYLQYEASLNRGGAAVLALALIAITIIILTIERFWRGRATGYARVGGGSQRPAAPVPLGVWRWPALAFCALIVGLSLILPLGVVTHWLIRGLAAGEPLRLLWGQAANSVSVSAAAAAAAMILALPIGILIVRFPGTRSGLLEQIVYMGYALPGIVVALALVFFGIHFATPLYQTVVLLILAYVVLFLPQAVGTVQSSLRQVNPHLEEAARLLGHRPAAVLSHITVPLVFPGLISGGALVFLTAMKELPATLLLSPIGFKTLATNVWSSTMEAFFARAAAPMLLLILVSSCSLMLILRQERWE